MQNTKELINILEITSLSKYFPGVQALNKVDFSIRCGEIHGLIGENGAGKSTLIKIISGSLTKDEGKMRFNNQDYEPLNPTDALQKGISTVYQELSLCENMNVAENLLINRHPKRGFIINYNALYELSLEYLKQFDLPVSPNDKVEDLSLAQRELVEILRAISYNPQLLILDEPTEPLSKLYVERLFKRLNELKDGGTSILYISHNISEVLQICDRITILRDGKKITTVNANEVTEEELASQMVGRDIGDIYPGVKSTPKEETILKVKNLASGKIVKDVNFELKRGEILGVAGLIGSGRTDMALAIFGYRKITSGMILIHDKLVHIRTPQDAIQHKIAYLPEDRHLLGLFLSYSIAENLLSNNLKNCSNYGLVDYKKLNKLTLEYIKELNIKCSGPQQIVNNLSGGNQQKTMLAKWLAIKPEILIFDEPTRGIDVGAKKAIHELLRKFIFEGMSIIMISSDLPEILKMSDRVMIMDKGYTVGVLKNDDSVTEEYIMNTIMSFKKGKNKGE